MKKVLSWIAASVGMMLVLPWMAVTFVKGDGGMAICFVLFFVLNPIYAICVGAAAGRDGRKLWALPVITALLFLIGTWLFFDWGEKAFFLYALIYLFLGIAAMLISMFIKRRENRMLSALTGTCILTERVGSVQDAGFFTGGNFKSEAAKSISGDGSDGSEDPKGAL